MCYMHLYCCGITCAGVNHLCQVVFLLYPHYVVCLCDMHDASVNAIDMMQIVGFFGSVLMLI